MATLNPGLVTQDMAAALNSAVEMIRANHKRVIYPEAVLLALIRSQDTAARRILNYYQEQRGLDYGRLERSVRLAVETRRDTDGDLRFIAADGEQVPLSRQMIVGLDEALSIAQAANAPAIDTDHMLAIMAEARISTGGLLRQHGITPSALSDLINGGGAGGSSKPNAPSTDVVAAAKMGSVRAVYFREGLLRDLTNMLSQKVNRHVILIGPDGVGKRTLAHSLGLQMAQGKGPIGLDKLVKVEETALLDNPVQAIANGLNQARGGVLFIPHIERFFGGPSRAEFAKALPNIQM